MKKFKILLSVIGFVLCAAMLVSCGSNGNSDDTKKDKTESTTAAQAAEGEYEINYLMSNELGLGSQYTLTSYYIITGPEGAEISDADYSNFKFNAKITNICGTVVYEGSPEVTPVGDGSVKCEINYDDVTSGATCLGTATLTLQAGKAVAENEHSLKLLPYDMSDMVVPDVPLTVNKLAGDGSIAATMEITEITKELRYRGDTVSVRVYVKATPKYSNGTNKYYGCSVTMSIDGKEVKTSNLISEANSEGIIEKYVTFEYVSGSAPVITIGDYK